jgi:toxin ParE1/3/4
VPLEVVWSRQARERLREIRTYIERDKPQAAERLAIRIVALAEALREHPYLGRTGSQADVRELVVAGTPYVIFYKIHHAKIKIMTVWHGARLKKPTF